MLLPALPSASGPFVGPGDRYPNRQLKTKSVPVWLLADSQPHSLHSLKRFFWRRSIVINHFGSKGASPALPSAPPCTEARRGPILARKRWASGIPASTLSSSGAGPNPCSPTTKPEFPTNVKAAVSTRSQSVGESDGYITCLKPRICARRRNRFDKLVGKYPQRPVAANPFLHSPLAQILIT